MTKQRRLLVKVHGDEGRQIIADAQAYADGINAYWAANGIDQEPATVNDVIAVTAFIGSIFGAGGGAEAANGDLLAGLRQSLGRKKGQAAWEDVMLADDPEAPTTIDERFRYGPLTGGKVTGSVVTRRRIDPRAPTRRVCRPSRRRRRPGPEAGVELPADRAGAFGHR